MNEKEKTAAKKYEDKLNRMIKESGVKRIWLSAQLDMGRKAFWIKARTNGFTDEQKNKIEKLLTHK